jgi:hypothetical protein
VLVRVRDSLYLQQFMKVQHRGAVEHVGYWQQQMGLLLGWAVCKVLPDQLSWLGTMMTANTDTLLRLVCEPASTAACTTVSHSRGALADRVVGACVE